MPELLLLLGIGIVVAIVIGAPLRGAALPVAPDGERDAAALRHRIALDAVRDVEADHRAGSLDGQAYLAERAAAEERAAATLVEVETAGQRRPAVAGDSVDRADSAQPARRHPSAGQLGAGIGVALAALLLVGYLLPAPISLANPSVQNRALAEAMAREAQRQAAITSALKVLSADPRNAAALSQLADAYLAGSSPADQQRGALALIALIGLHPNDAAAYRRLITAYANNGDWTDASAATDSLAKIAPRSPDVPFFRGLIALRGTGDRQAAIRQFDAFLKVAPDDPRATMIRTLRSEALATAAPSPSVSP
ncbi:MAG: tetratricopeptide repeat protein [Chloroflexota bacterium]|nr:tetratricopeptide repeat protein [Chloroflexota bacterium]